MKEEESISKLIIWGSIMLEPDYLTGATRRATALDGSVRMLLKRFSRYQSLKVHSEDSRLSKNKRTPRDEYMSEAVLH